MFFTGVQNHSYSGSFVIVVGELYIDENLIQWIELGEHIVFKMYVSFTVFSKEEEKTIMNYCKIELVFSKIETNIQKITAHW